MKLWMRLALLFLVLGIAPVLILGHFAYRRGQSALLSEAESHLASVAVLKEDALLEWIEGNIALLESVSERPIIGELSLQLATTARGTPGWTTSHDRLLNSHLDPNTTAGIEALSVLHPENGQILASTEQLLEGRFRESDEYFLRGREATFRDHVRYNVAAEALTLHLSTPIQSPVGELIAVLTAHVDLEEMGRIVRLTSGAHESQDIYLINESSLFVTEPKFGEGFALRRMLNTEGANNVLQGGSGVSSYLDYTGTAVVGAYRWIESLSMGLLVETDRAEIVQPMRALGLTVLLGEAIAAVVVCMFSVLFARGVVRPIHRLIAGANQIGEGNLDHRIAVRGRHEIAQLGLAFNRMTDNLTQITASRDELDREVRARTAAERRLNETVRALEQSERQFRQLSDASPVGVFMIRDMKLQYINSALERMFGYSAEEAIDRLGPLDLTDPVQHEDSATYIAQCFAGVSDLPPFFFRGIRKDGSTVYCEALARPIEHGGAPALLGTILDVTARREAEAELRLKNTVFESSIAANSTADINGIITHANPAFLKLWGYDSRDEVIGRSIADFLAREEEAISIITQLNEKGEWEGDFTGLRKDGSTFISNGHATAIRDEQGQMIGYQSANLDVTEQRRSDALLHEQWENTKSILDGIPHVIYVADPSSYEVLFVNSYFRELLGSDPVGKQCYEAFQGFDAPCDFCTNERILNSNEPYDWEYYNPMVKRHFLISDRIIRWADRPQARLELAMDVTERKTLELEMVKAKEITESVIESLPGVFYQISAEERFLRWNRMFTEVSGYTDDEMREMNPLELFHGGDQERVGAEIQRVFEEGQGNVTADFVSKDGTRRPYFFTGVRMVIDGDPSLIGVGTDISELARIEAELRQSMDKLTRSNQELEQFAYVASHDLQEPLRMVSSYTQLLEKRYKDALDEDAKDFIHYAVDGANRMQRLISDLLEFSRVQTRGKPFEQVDLNSVLGYARRNLAAAIDESGALVSNDELPTAWIDANQILSVFQNLLSNGIKFRGDARPVLHVAVDERETEWEFSIKDNGIGISPEFHDRIFVIFQRLHSRAEYAGTGIGLAMCKRIVERHGGRIWVESAVGEGTTFRFTLPKQQKEAV